jgi:tRNA/rRNA methyltransferase
MTFKVNLDNISIVLNGPRIPENIGASARAMCNMGFRQLVVVNPGNCDLSRVLKMATQAAWDVVENLQVYDNLQQALAPYHYVVGTTARLGKHRQVMVSHPSHVAERLISLSQKNQVAILFGPEDRGLMNEDVRLCHELVNIPTHEFSSLNLAQAVMIMCYELFTTRSTNIRTCSPRLASRHELDGMYDQLKEILVRISYINSENPEYWMDRIRNFFSRFQLRAGEVSIIRGICRQINWYGEKRYKDGMMNQD